MTPRCLLNPWRFTPYFKVKPHGWDNQWNGDEDYLKWLDSCLVQFWRVLKPSGSIYLFCGHRLAAETELLVKKRFNLLSHIIWAKPAGPWKGCNKESLRSYFPSTERILFADHYLGPYRPKDDGYERKGRELKQHLLSPLIEYFQNARTSLNVSAKDIVEATGKKHMVSHWFGASQWQLPSEADYCKLQELFSRVANERHQSSHLVQPHHQLVATYHSLNQKYCELLAEYKSLRRYFAVTSAVPYTDVWTHKPVQFYAGKHPCEKPREMLRQIINASSRPGDVIADFFMGSGSSIKEAIELGRKAIGVEIEKERFDQTVCEIAAMTQNNSA